jgi:hypothetical protein
LKALIKIFFLLLFILFGCNTKKDLSTDTNSNKFINKADKITFMEKYYTPNFDYVDVEYHIIYHDNGTGRGVSGPSDWYMQFAFKVGSAVLATISQQEESKLFEIDNRIDFIPKNVKWNIDDAKTYYKSGDVIIVDNNILLREVTNN